MLHHPRSVFTARLLRNNFQHSPSGGGRDSLQPQMRIHFNQLGFSALAFGLLLVTGCVAPARFLPYVGEQQNWPISPGTYAKAIMGIQVYSGPPSKPYIVLGRVSASGRAQHARGIMRGMVEEAKRHGGQAIIIEHEQTFSTGSISTGGGSSTYGSASATRLGDNVVMTGQAQTYDNPTFQTATFGIDYVGQVIRFTGEAPSVPEDESYRQNRTPSNLSQPNQRK